MGHGGSKAWNGFHTPKWAKLLDIVKKIFSEGSRKGCNFVSAIEMLLRWASASVAHFNMLHEYAYKMNIRKKKNQCT